MLKTGIGMVKKWVEGGRVLWLSSAVSYILMCRGSELFTDGSGKVHKELGLTKGDVAFFKDDVHLFTPALWPCANRNSEGHDFVGGACV